MDNWLEHHGIKGQKWGVRRYQNFDGSYTQTGIKRHRQAYATYQDKKEKYNSIKKTGEKGKVSLAKKSMHLAKSDMNRSYKQLKKDKLADQGKALYAKGTRIRQNNNTYKATSVIAGLSVAALASGHLADIGKKRMYTKGNKVFTLSTAELATATIAAGSVATAAIVYGKNRYQNRRLSEYYGHKGFQQRSN